MTEFTLSRIDHNRTSSLAAPFTRGNEVIQFHLDSASSVLYIKTKYVRNTSVISLSFRHTHSHISRI